MKKSTKYLIARLGIMALCVALGFGLGWISKEPEVVEINITRPNVSVFEPVEEIEKTPTYTEMQVVATAYCPCEKCCGKSDGITATGVKAKAGRTISVDPKVIPYGSEVIIDDNTYIAEDCGGVIKGNRIDIFFDDHISALEFGVKKLDAYIIFNE